MNVIAATDLLFFDQQDPIGPDRSASGYSAAGRVLAADRQRYIVWVDAGRPSRHATHRPELAPRQALHLVECRNGGGS